MSEVTCAAPAAPEAVETMNVRDSLATVSLIVCALGGCADATDEGDPAEETFAADEPLDITVDTLDIVHGALRVRATMVDGAADVSVRLGGDCAHREVGGGLSTQSTLVWSFGDNDVADAIGCGLLVRARVRDGTGYVNRVGELGVAVDVAVQGVDGARDGPGVQALAASETGVYVIFAPVTRGSRLTTGDSILAAELLDPAGDELPADDETGRFTVPRIDFARSVLSGRPLYLDGSSFATSLSVGGTSLQSEAQGADEAQAAVELQEAEEPREAQQSQEAEQSQEAPP
jgi:hypothetical protein